MSCRYLNRICKTQIRSISFRPPNIVNRTLFNIKLNRTLFSKDFCLRKYPMSINSITTNTECLEEVSFDEINSKADCDFLLIDVREPNELLEDGKIPGSINIPLGDLEEALGKLPKDIFYKKYGGQKPDKNKEIIFHCKTGKRGRKAQLLALQLGFKNIKNYAGGYVDWAEKIKKQ